MKIPIYFKHYYYTNKYYDLKLWVKSKYQKLRYGFEYQETWNLYQSLATWVLPRLKHLKKNKQGIPSACFDCEKYKTPEEQQSDGAMKDAEKRWDGILNEIIFAFEFYEDDYKYLMACYPPDYDFGFDTDEKSYIVWNDNRAPDYTSYDAAEKRAKEGLKLFAEYYANLWD